MDERKKTILKKYRLTKMALVLCIVAVANFMALNLGLHKAWQRTLELPYHEDVARALKVTATKKEIPVAGDLWKQRDLLQERLDKWCATPWRPSEKTQRDQALVEIRSRAREFTFALDRAKEEFARSEVEKTQSRTNAALAQVKTLEEALGREQRLRQAAETGLNRKIVDRGSTEPPQALENSQQPDAAEFQKQAGLQAESTLIDAVADHIWNMTGVYKCYLVQELPILTTNIENPDNLTQLLRTEESAFADSHQNIRDLSARHRDAVGQAIKSEAKYALPSSLHSELCDAMASSLDVEPSEALVRVRKLAQDKARANQ